MPSLVDKLSRAQQRLTLASFGALMAHCCLFVLGWLVIQQISIPSKENRALVLTLESTPEDGPALNDPPPQNTINNAKVGDATGLPEQEPLSELSQLTTVTHAKPTFELQPELKAEPTPTAEVASVSEAQATQPPKVIEPLTPTVRAEVQPPVSPSSSVFDSDFLTADLGLLAWHSPSTIEPQPAAEKTVIPTQQQRMIQRKLQNWARQQDTLETVEESFSWQHKGQTYVAKFSHLPASNDMELDQVIVEVRTEQDGQSLQTQMRMKKLAFSNFAQFVHRWDPEVKMHKDELDGRFHSNSQILLDFDRQARPVFHGKVTTASYRVNFEKTARRKTRSDIFRGGLETGVKRIHMPRPQMEFANDAGNLDSHSVSFSDDTRLVFEETGDIVWQQLAASDTADIDNGRIPPSAKPIYLLADEGVTLYVSGRVKGKAMVYSPQRIVVEDDLTYVSLDAGDVLGLVSGRDIVIAKQKFTGPGDLDIHASIYARRRFLVRDYGKPHTGTLNILGSVSAGSFSATQPRYATKISFDKRFEKLRPPGFPLTDTYEVASANQAWSAVITD